MVKWRENARDSQAIRDLESQIDVADGDFHNLVALPKLDPARCLSMVERRLAFPAGDGSIEFPSTCVEITTAFRFAMACAAAVLFGSGPSDSIA